MRKVKYSDYRKIRKGGTALEAKLKRVFGDHIKITRFKPRRGCLGLYVMFYLKPPDDFDYVHRLFYNGKSIRYHALSTPNKYIEKNLRFIKM